MLKFTKKKLLFKFNANKNLADSKIKPTKLSKLANH